MAETLVAIRTDQAIEEQGIRFGRRSQLGFEGKGRRFARGTARGVRREERIKKKTQGNDRGRESGELREQYK